MVSGSDDAKLFLWQPEREKKPIKRLDGHANGGTIVDVKFSPDTHWVKSFELTSLGFMPIYEYQSHFSPEASRANISSNVESSAYEETWWLKWQMFCTSNLPTWPQVLEIRSSFYFPQNSSNCPCQKRSSTYFVLECELNFWWDKHWEEPDSSTLAS